MRRSAALLMLVVARIMLAQNSGATVSGVVRDTLARAPLSGASVQLMSTESQARVARTTTSDAAGRYQLTDVPDGRYQLGFFHSALDSLGIEPMLREIVVADRRAVRADLSTPTGAQLRVSVCPSTAASDSDGFIMGVVRDIRRAPLGDAAVTADWLEYTIGIDGVVGQLKTARTTTRANGWFVLCNLPRIGTTVLRAMRGADTTDRVEAEIAANGFLRRELYLGAARTVAFVDTVALDDTVSITPRIVRSGDGRLLGRVFSGLGNQPLNGVRVGIPDGPQTRTNKEGEWMLSGVPFGTRAVEFHAIGFYPERMSVDVVEAPAPIHTSMRTMKAMLDTVRITAVSARNQEFAQFLERQRSGVGHYVTMAEIERRRPITISDLFKIMPGARLNTDPLYGPMVYVRHISQVWCRPTYVIDGLRIGQMTGDEMDMLSSPEEISGIEVYSGANAPGQFRDFGGCGVILVWTKMSGTPRRPWTKRNAIATVSLLGLSLLTGTVFMR